MAATAPQPTTHVEAVRIAAGSDAFPGMLDELSGQINREIRANKYLFAKIVDLHSALQDCIDHPRNTYDHVLDWDPALRRFVIVAMMIYYEFYRREMVLKFPAKTVRILTPMQEEEGLRLLGMLQGTSHANIPEIMRRTDAVDKFYGDRIKEYKVDKARTPPEAFVMYNLPLREGLLRAGIMGSFLDMMKFPRPGEEVSLDTVMRFLNYENQFNYVAWAMSREPGISRAKGFIDCVIDLSNKLIKRTDDQVKAKQAVNVSELHSELLSVVNAVIIAGILEDNKRETYKALHMDDLLLRDDTHPSELPHLSSSSRADDTSSDPPPAAGCHGGRGRKKRGMHYM